MAYSFSSPIIWKVELALALDRLGPENGRSVPGVVCGDGRKRTPETRGHKCAEESRRLPQGLKPMSLQAFCGTAEAAPFQNRFMR